MPAADPGRGAAAWRAMREADLPTVAAIAAAVHPDYPEGAAVFAERLRLFPSGCHVLEREGGIAGYALSHPWRRCDPPPLDTLLGALPERPETFYVHDIAILPEARGGGAGRRIVDILAATAAAAGLSEMSLVAVGGSAAFWRRNGFAAAGSAALARKLLSYGAGAAFMERRLSGERGGR